MLANTEKLPDGHFSSDEKVHGEAHLLLAENKTEEAWKLLISKS